MKLDSKKFTWGPDDITIIPPKGQVEILALIQGIATVEDLQRWLPRIEGWMNENPNDISVATALIEVVGEL